MRSPENLFIDLTSLSHLDDSAIVGKTVRIRKPDRVSIGAHSILDDFTYISCGLTVGRYTHIGANGALIGGDAHIVIGDFVNIAPGCRLVAASHDFTHGGLTGPTIPEAFSTPGLCEDIAIANHVLLGANTVVLPGLHIPEGVSSGAGTIFTKETALRPWTLYVGAPARPIGLRESKAILAAAKNLLDAS